MDQRQAEELMAATAQRLEEMAAKSAQPGARFAELQPMIKELEDIWARVDAALKEFPRPEAKRIRETQSARTGVAASALSKNLIAAKMRDGGSGLYQRPKIVAKADTIGDRFAVAIVKKDYEGACALMAPWLQERWTREVLQRTVEEGCAEIGRGFDMDTPPPAADYEVGSNPMGIADLRDEYFVQEEPIPDQITEENFIAWVPVTIIPDEEDTYLTNIGFLLAPYLITVKDNGMEKIGYLRFGEE